MSELYVVIMRANVYLSQRTPGREVKLPMKQLMSTQRCLLAFHQLLFWKKKDSNGRKKVPQQNTPPSEGLVKTLDSINATVPVDFN